MSPSKRSSPCPSPAPSLATDQVTGDAAPGDAAQVRPELPPFHPSLLGLGLYRQHKVVACWMLVGRWRCENAQAEQGLQACQVVALSLSLSHSLSPLSLSNNAALFAHGQLLACIVLHFDSLATLW
eukprot:scaffold86963_cov17-Tisochrysis_lutea.AAC.5